LILYLEGFKVKYNSEIELSTSRYCYLCRAFYYQT